MNRLYVYSGAAAILVAALFVSIYLSRTVELRLHSVIAEQQRTIATLTAQHEARTTTDHQVTTRKRTTIKAPDGTLTVAEETSTDSAKVKTEVADKVSSTTDAAKAAVTEVSEAETVGGPSPYSVFITQTLSADWHQAHVGVAARLGGTPLSVQGEMGLDLASRVGIRLDF